MPHTSHSANLTLKPDAFMVLRWNGSFILLIYGLLTNVLLLLCPLTYVRHFLFPTLRRNPKTIAITKLIVDSYVLSLLSVQAVLLFCVATPEAHRWIVVVAIFSLVDVLGSTLLDILIAPSLHEDASGHFVLVQDPIRWFVMAPLSVLQVVLGFALLFRSYAGHFHGAGGPLTDPLSALYFSAVTIATVGYGDITPNSDSSIGQILVLTEILYFFFFILMKLPLALSIARVRGGGSGHDSTVQSANNRTPDRPEDFMPTIQGPLDGNRSFRGHACTYHHRSSSHDEPGTCGHDANLRRPCALATCPLVGDAAREVELLRRSILHHTPPARNSPGVSFPEEHAAGRIRLPSGTRLLDWEGDRWKAYLKDGVQWFSDDLADSDFEVLSDRLREQINAAFS